MPPVSQHSLVKVSGMSNADHNTTGRGVTQANGSLSVVDPQPPEPSADLLGDLLSPLAIEGSPGAAVQSKSNMASGPQGAPSAEEKLALALVEDQTNTVQPRGNIAERFHALCLKDSGVLYEDPCIQIDIKAEWQAHQGQLVLFLGNKNTAPLLSVQPLILPPFHLKMELSLVPETIPPRAQVQCRLEIINLQPSRDLAVLDFSYKFGTHVVNVKLRLPAVLNKFLQPISLSAEEFFPQWRSLSGPPLKLQEVLRIETDPAGQTQLRMTIASGDPNLTYELNEFIKEQLISIPTTSRAPAAAPPQAQPASPPAPVESDPGALLAGLLD